MSPVRPGCLPGSGDFRKWWDEYRLPMLAAFAVNMLAFGYLFFAYIYTNHTFPNITHQIFPSFRTDLEGRWGADLVYLLQGRKGIPLLDLMLAVPIQIANGVLFARILNLKDAWSIFLSATLVSVHPFVSDYYAFSGDHLVFVVGDGLILLAFLVVSRHFRSLWAVPLAAVLIQAGLSCYQPKIGLVATLFVCVAMARLASWDGTGPQLRQGARELLLHGLGILAGAALYLMLLKLSQWWLSNPAEGNAHSAIRLAIIDPSLILSRVRDVLSLSREALLSADYFGPVLRMLPGLLLLLLVALIAGRLAVNRSSTADRMLAMVTLALALGLLPFAMLAPFMLSHVTYPAGRVLTPIAYVTAFLPLMLLRFARGRIARTAVLGLALFVGYRFVLVNAEMGHLAHLRSEYELHFVNRVLSRIDQVIVPAPDRNYALVVVGEVPLPRVLIPSTSQARSNQNDRGFIHYREVEMLNFMSGTERFRFPDAEQVRRALDLAAQSPVWPEDQSVAVLDGSVVVVVLQKPGERVTTTMTAR